MPAHVSDQTNLGVNRQVVIRHLGLAEYQPVWQAMQAFTDQRDQDTVDEIWLLQHPPVFTQGQAGKAEHLLAPGDIPVVQVDRGGQVTYHGPGQLVAYLLVDLKRRKLGVRDFVTLIENTLVEVLLGYQISASPRADAPGVYVDSEENAGAGAKIAQLGLRIRRGCSFHGLSLNIEMDMQPFQRINPCGHVGMAVTSVQLERAEAPSVEAVAVLLTKHLTAKLGYTSVLSEPAQSQPPS